MNQSLVVILVILSVCAYIGSALDCYRCDSVDNSELQCSNPSGRKSKVTTCRSGEVCVKLHAQKVIIDNDNSYELAGRRCGPPSMCDDLPSESKKYCSTCNTNLCNSAVTIMPALSTAIILYTIKFIFL